MTSRPSPCRISGTGEDLAIPCQIRAKRARTNKRVKPSGKWGRGETRLAKSIAAHEQDDDSTLYTLAAALPIAQSYTPQRRRTSAQLYILPPIAEVTRETHAQSHWP